MIILAPLLLLDPVAQVQELHKIFVDEVTYEARWREFCLKFKGQLQDSNLLVRPVFHCYELSCDHCRARPLSYSMPTSGFSPSTLLIEAVEMPFKWQATCPW